MSITLDVVKVFQKNPTYRHDKSPGEARDKRDIL